VVEEPVPDAFAGIDRCTDWYTPPGQSGFKLVVCNQKILKRDLNGALSPPAGDPRVVGARSRSPTVREVPAVDYEPTAAALAADGIVAAVPTPVNVYVAYDKPRARGQLTALFRNVPATSRPLHVHAAGARWAIVTGSGRIIRTKRPTVLGVPPKAPRGCSISADPTTVTAGGHPTAVLVTVRGPHVCSPLHSRKLVLVLITRTGARPGTFVALNASRAPDGRLAVSITLPPGTTSAGLGLLTRYFQLVTIFKLHVHP
jgi:hypothetical protein